MNIYQMSSPFSYDLTEAVLASARLSQLPFLRPELSLKDLEKRKVRCSSPLPPGSTERRSASILLPGYQRKKSQSVKLTRIDPNGPCPKKAVRFSDDFGLALNQIKWIITDELPSVPSTASKHLQTNGNETSATLFYPERTRLLNYMVPQFENPLYAQNFNERLSQQKVVLEQANAIDNRIYGTVKLCSDSLHKRVKVRLTTDNWLSSRDIDATYVPNSCNRFSFTLEIDCLRMCAGNTIEFCICYEPLGGPAYWDNNHQQNYRFDCVSRTIPDYSI